jgi:hypothetical protein
LQVLPIAAQASVLAIAVGLILVCVFYELLEPYIKKFGDWITGKKRAEAQRLAYQREQEQRRAAAEKQAREEIEEISLRGKG